MAVQIPADIQRRARAADPERKYQLLAMALGVYVPDLDMPAATASIRAKLAAGATLWDATEQWASKRSDACLLLRRLQTEGIEGEASVDKGTLVLAAVIVFLLFVKRR